MILEAIRLGFTDDEIAISHKLFPSYIAQFRLIRGKDKFRVVTTGGKKVSEILRVNNGTSYVLEARIEGESFKRTFMLTGHLIGQQHPTELDLAIELL